MILQNGAGDCPKLARYWYNPAGGPWSDVDQNGDVQSIAVGGDGGLYVLNNRGDLVRYWYNPAGGPWSDVDHPIDNFPKKSHLRESPCGRAT